MQLTGKCKTAFEKWFKVRFGSIKNTLIFKVDDVWLNIEAYPESMKYSVYVDFFDSVGIDIYIQNGNEVMIYTPPFGGLEYSDIGHEERHEARRKAIDKANEIFNTKES